MNEILTALHLQLPDCLNVFVLNYIHVYTHCTLYLHDSGVETASHAGHCPIHLVNVW